MGLRKSALMLSAAALLVLSGCNSSDVLDVARKANQPLPQDVVRIMKAKGMTKSSPVMMRIFKEEGVLEVWKQKHTGRYDLVKTYEICKWSGEKGPKFKEGDRQAPEGFYFVNRGLMNPYSSYYLAFNLGFPNKFDRAHGRTGTNLMVHGACSSSGCYSMTDKQVAEIYAFARDALAGGQEAFQVQAFPFRMTPENMAKHKDSPHFDYWQMIKEGYDHFEITKLPPKVDVCDRKYVFNQTPIEGSFEPTRACPPSQMPQSLALAYGKLKNKEAVEFEKVLAKLEGRKPSDVTPVSVAPAAVAEVPSAQAQEDAPAAAVETVAEGPDAAASEPEAPMVVPLPDDRPVGAIQ